MAKVISTKPQLNRLVELLKENIDIAKAICIKQEAHMKWQEFAVELNKLGPPYRSWDKWMRVWWDLKCKIKKKKSSKPIIKTLPSGARINYLCHFTDLEKTVIEMLGWNTDENVPVKRKLESSPSEDDGIVFEPSKKRMKYSTYESVESEEEQPSTSIKTKPEELSTSTSIVNTVTILELEESSSEYEEVFEDTISICSIEDNEVKLELTDFDEEITQHNIIESPKQQATEELPTTSIKTEPEEEEHSSIIIKTEPEEYSISSSPINETVPKPIILPKPTRLPRPKDDCEKLLEEQISTQKIFYKNMIDLMGDMKRSMSQCEDSMKKTYQQKDDLLEMKRLKLKEYKKKKIDQAMERKQNMKLKQELLALKKSKLSTIFACRKYLSK